VRGLLSYDRKLKNAVPKAIKKILEDEGLIIEWKMERDRLKFADLYPCVETHLTFIRLDPKLGDPSFVLPRASVRLVSMARAIFDFGSSGYATDDSVDGKSAKRAVYPTRFEQLFGASLPGKILKLEMKSPTESR